MSLMPVPLDADSARCTGVREAGGDLVEDARVIDVYESAQVEAGHKPMAVNVGMRAADHTLSADEVLGVRGAVIAAAQGEVGAVLRWPWTGWMLRG